eukprot:m.209623 g.209623  ORF g.209623 m.209623 type:complete len:60 (+) comp39727_c0_seq59:47-226(+)
MIALCALLVFSLFYAASSSSTPEAGNHINIWIIAHSHDDTGWKAMPITPSSFLIWPFSL